MKVKTPLEILDIEIAKERAQILDEELRIFTLQDKIQEVTNRLKTLVEIWNKFGELDESSGHRPSTLQAPTQALPPH